MREWYGKPRLDAFSKNRDSPGMLAHYSAVHTGMHLEYEVGEPDISGVS